MMFIAIRVCVFFLFMNRVSFSQEQELGWDTINLQAGRQVAFPVQLPFLHTQPGEHILESGLQSHRPENSIFEVF